jgi:hypothetical protein
MRYVEFEEWMENPCTREFLDLIKEHQKASKDAITDLMLNVQSISQVDLHQVSQLRGQSYALESILNTELFMRELIDEEVQTVRPESDN